MLIDGEKWACEACVRGHRVSNCQHYDRPLQHINKKGRPVTQCQHCRSQRKNRSAHVKCDCGEKTTKCVHLGGLEGHRESCCCNHGGRCSCSFKKDLDTVPESAATDNEATDDPALLAKPSASASTAGSASGGSCCGGSKNHIRRRRANTTRSEGTLTFDEHGRHKPVSHKHAKAASQKSNPYGFNRISSVRSTGGLSGFLQAATKSAVKAEEETEEDDLSSRNAASDSGADEDDSMGVTTAATTPAVAVPTPNGASILPAQLSAQRRTRSETASPLLFGGSFPQPHQLSTNSQLSPLNMGAISFSAYNFSSFNTPEQTDQPLFSAGLSAPSVDWSQFGLDFGTTDAEKFSSSDAFGFASTFGNEFNGSEQAPTMTTATSGDVSEAEDFMGPGLDDFDYDFDNNGTDAASSSVAAFSRTSSTFNLPTSSVNLGAAASNNNSDYQELRFLKASNKFLPTPQTSAADELTALAVTTNLPSAVGLDDDDNTLWMPDYHGLPSMTESPESDIISFWGTK